MMAVMLGMMVVMVTVGVMTMVVILVPMGVMMMVTTGLMVTMRDGENGEDGDGTNW